MASNLIKAGHELVVWNRTPERCEPLVEMGAAQARVPAEVIRHCDATFAMVSDPEASLDLSAGGVLDGMGEGKLQFPTSRSDRPSITDSEGIPGITRSRRPGDGALGLRDEVVLVIPPGRKRLEWPRGPTWAACSWALGEGPGRKCRLDASEFRPGCFRCRRPPIPRRGWPLAFRPVANRRPVER